MVHPPSVVVSRQDPRYFELTDGTPYIPVGFNLVGSPEEDELTSVVSDMASHRVNFCRIWVGHGIWDVEGEKSGVYDEAKAQILDRFLAEAGRGGIRVKMCLEYFRDIPAVRELRAFGLQKPILLAETGAVKPHHAGCSELHAMDPEGMLVHDMLFAPFFAGAAGTGNPWFWRECIQKPNHWHHFARFAAAVEGIAPPAERFEPSMLDHERLRVYVLTGRTTLLAWCRDVRNDWQSELVQGQPPDRLEGLTLALGASFKGRRLERRRAYDPWADTWVDLDVDAGIVKLPAFRRSIVVRLQYGC